VSELTKQFRNDESGWCLGVNGEIKAEASVISLPCQTGDQSMFSWVLTDLGNDIIRIQPQLQPVGAQPLCMDVDLLKDGVIPVCQRWVRPVGPEYSARRA
jgi:hypothetical protein